MFYAKHNLADLEGFVTGMGAVKTKRSPKVVTRGAGASCPAGVPVDLTCPASISAGILKPFMFAKNCPMCPPGYQAQPTDSSEKYWNCVLENPAACAKQRSGTCPDVNKAPGYAVNGTCYYPYPEWWPASGWTPCMQDYGGWVPSVPGLPPIPATTSGYNSGGYCVGGPVQSKSTVKPGGHTSTKPTAYVKYLDPTVNYFTKLWAARMQISDSNDAAGMGAFLDALHSLTGTTGLTPSASDVKAALQQSGIDLSDSGPMLQAFTMLYLSTYGTSTSAGGTQNALVKNAIFNLIPMVQSMVNSVNYAEQEFNPTAQSATIPPVQSLKQSMNQIYAQAGFDPLRPMTSDEENYWTQKANAQVTNFTKAMLWMSPAVEATAVGMATNEVVGAVEVFVLPKTLTAAQMASAQSAAQAAGGVVAVVAMPVLKDVAASGVHAGLSSAWNSVKASLKGLNGLGQTSGASAAQDAALALALVYAMQSVDKAVANSRPMSGLGFEATADNFLGMALTLGMYVWLISRKPGSNNGL